MNRQELSTHIKQSEQNINEILKGLGLQLDQPDYTPEQVNAIEAVVSLVANKQAKTFQGAVGIYRKPEREQQLKEIALRHSIPEDLIPKMLEATKLKLETLTDEQVELFLQVCQLQNTGLDLDMASQAAINDAKEAKGKAKSRAKQEPVAQAEPEAVSEGGGSKSAIALTQPKTITIQLPEDSEASLQDVADAVAAAVTTTDISDTMADIAVQVNDQIEKVAEQMILEAIFGENSPIKPDKDRAVARVHELQAQRRQQRGY